MSSLTFVAAILAVLTACLSALWFSRQSLYRTLGGLQATYAGKPLGLGLAESSGAMPLFDQRLVRLENFLPHSVFDDLHSEIGGLVETERSYLPTHKKGGTVAYETLLRKAPKTVQLYLSDELSRFVSEITGVQVWPTPVYDQSSCSVLFYERPGDHIGWHYDHNFYKGRHLTVLFSIINSGHMRDGLSAARLEAVLDGEVVALATPPNTLTVFEGQKVLHRVTPIGEGERRVVLSMTFTTDPSASLLQGLKRRIKDTAFFGIRALWT